jgi:hypothetical protein
MFNLGPDSAPIKFDWHEVDALRNTHFADHPPRLIDLIDHSEVAPSQDGIDVNLPSHGSRIFRLMREK